MYSATRPQSGSFSQRRTTRPGSAASSAHASSRGSSLVVAPKPPKDATQAAAATIRCQSASTARLNRRRQYAHDRILDDSLVRPSSARTAPLGTGASRLTTANSNALGQDDAVVLNAHQNVRPNRTVQSAGIFRTQPPGFSTDVTVPKPPTVARTSPGAATKGPTARSGSPRNRRPQSPRRKKAGGEQKNENDGPTQDPILNLFQQIAQLQGKQGNHPLVEDYFREQKEEEKKQRLQGLTSENLAQHDMDEASLEAQSLSIAAGSPTAATDRVAVVPGSPNSPAKQTQQQRHGVSPPLQKYHPDHQDVLNNGEDSDSDICQGSTAGGRKAGCVSTRMIRERMERRLEVYRTDAVQRKMLKQRVRRFKSVQTGGKLYHHDEFGLPIIPDEVQMEDRARRQEDLLEKGVTILEDYYADREKKFESLKLSARDGATWMVRNKERAEHHKATAQRVWREELAHKKAVMARHDDIVAEAKLARQKEAASLVACEWSNVIAVTLRAQRFVKTLMLKDYMRKLQSSHETRKRYFMRWMVPTERKLHCARKDYLWRRVRFAIFAARIWAMISLRRRGCMMLTQYLRDVREAGKMFAAFHHFRKKVLLCQTHIRNYLRYRTVRLNLLMLRWDQKEEQLREELREEYRLKVIRDKTRTERQQRPGYIASDTSSPTTHTAAPSKPATVATGPHRRSRGTSVHGQHHRRHHGSTKGERPLHPSLRGVSGQDLETMQAATIKKLLMQDPFSYDTPIPLSLKLNALTDDWVARRAAFVKRDLRVQYYSDKFEYERKMRERERILKEGGKAASQLSPPPQPPQLRPFPLFMPAKRFDELIAKTLERYKDEVMDIRQQAAAEIARTGQSEVDYIPLRMQYLKERYKWDEDEKRKFYNKMVRHIYSGPSLKGPLNPLGGSMRIPPRRSNSMVSTTSTTSAKELAEAQIKKPTMAIFRPL